MGEVIIKPDADHDFYVIWSDGTESPIAFGTRAQLLEHLSASDQVHRCPAGGHPLSECARPYALLNRADAFGSTASHGYRLGHWPDRALVYRQHGLLRREDLAAACELLAQGRDDEVLTLLRPFEDCT